MERKYFIFFLLAMAFAHAEDKCAIETDPVRIGAKHIEAKGIGYDRGYTTLEFFFAASEAWGDEWVPFLNVRGHLFNNGKPAANAGFGLRYLADRVWGVNGYYDFRKTHRKSYQQWSIGVETLGETWDVRLNGYLPLGRSTSSSFGTKFSGFKNNSMLLSRRREFALKGANAEAGIHVDCFEKMPLYFAGGPYYLTGEGKTAWGGEIRGMIDFFKYVRLEASTSYDHLFKWIGQGQLSLFVSFGGKKEVKSKNSCLTLRKRAVEPVMRREIIPIDKKTERFKAINPLTGQPYVFWFVNNTSHSNGTFASPFNTLSSAQSASSAHDVIYVFPGDGTSKGMNAGITLKDNQKLFGAGIPHELKTASGLITIPPQASGMPFIENPNFDVVVCANRNEIAGLHILLRTAFSNAPAGINCTEIQDVFIHQNLLEATNHANGIVFDDFTGTATVIDNTMTMDAIESDGVYFLDQPTAARFVLKNNRFIGQAAGSGSVAVFLGGFNSFGGDYTFQQNQFTNCDLAVAGNPFTYSSSIVFDQNILTYCGHLPSDIVFFGVQASGQMNIQATGNQWIHSGPAGTSALHVQDFNTAHLGVTLKNNIGDKSYLLENLGKGSFKIDAAANVPHHTAIGPVMTGAHPFSPLTTEKPSKPSCSRCQKKK